jgi:ABC-type molybdate transport system substrate-binding protein
MMRKTTGTLLATLLLAATGGSALSAEVTVMISGGFKAALEKLAPAWKTNWQPSRGDPRPVNGENAAGDP